jgi:hypothetical protein
MSDKKIMSAFRLVTPYTFSRWFRLPIEDMINELQLTEAMVILGTVLSAACMLDSAKRADKIKAAKGAVPPNLLFLGKRVRHAWLSIADLAPEGASPIMVGPRGSAGDEAGSAGKGGFVLGSVHKLRQRREGGIYLFLLLQNFFSRWNPIFFLHSRLTIIVFRANFTCLTVTPP